ncbi:major facilitator superfamily domain-containing protein [Microdochium bolleyi]|uniref:Major facilitator superfamily domain-containing protein n=1 Tax=Microdochium bolleyi TaxID=196109 RepID=A0A136IVE5_9PEZI|nr:major facilitator superfamily domain-containing protein [Microdochium bolleyi]
MSTNEYAREPLLGNGSTSSTGIAECPPPSYGSLSSTSDKGDCHVDIGPAQDELDLDSPDGVQQADAVNLVWTKSALILAYCFIFMCSFANTLQWQIMSNLMPYVVSEFSSHSLIPTIGIVASVMSGVFKLPVARMIDSWGRPQGLAAMIFLATTGLILMALSSNVKQYAASEVVYQIGISGFSYVLDIIVADTSSLKNRSIAFAFNASPALLTTFIGPILAKLFYTYSTWRWAFVSSALLFVIMSIPVLAILLGNVQKAKARGLLVAGPKTERWTAKRLSKVLQDNDAFGIVLITFGLTLILVPFSLVGSTSSEDFHTNAFLVTTGFIFMAMFAMHERQARRPVLDFSLLFSRNVAGACLLQIVIFIAYFSWDGYYTSYLQVVHDLSITEAGYIGHIYGLGSCIWAGVVGYLIRRSDRFKWIAWAALPVHILGGIAMILVRRPDTHLGWLVAVQVLITIGGSSLVICCQMAVMSVANHGQLASVLALLSLASYVGSAMGSSLSGAIWNSTLPNALAEFLPQLSAPERAAIAADLAKQLSYPMGHPIRAAVIAAYDLAQVRMCITGALVSLFEIAAVVVWRDVSVSGSSQVKGTVL